MSEQQSQFSSLMDKLEAEVKAKEKDRQHSIPDQTSQAEMQLEDKLNKTEIKTRSGLTWIFLIGFFVLIVGSAFFVLVYNHYAVQWIQQLNSAEIKNFDGLIKPLEFEKVASLIINSLGTSLGFIIGYYFKEKSSK
ncbi:hypothetical protein ACPV36_07295 [Photobacterium damselae]|uniref:hypothetical protein n=1 Tax=Photobacterium damselae TaxID=38293 RepID=UPI0040688110